MITVSRPRMPDAPNKKRRARGNVPEAKRTPSNKNETSATMPCTMQTKVAMWLQRLQRVINGQKLGLSFLALLTLGAIDSNGGAQAKAAVAEALLKRAWERSRYSEPPMRVRALLDSNLIGIAQNSCRKMPDKIAY